MRPLSMQQVFDHIKIMRNKSGPREFMLLLQLWIWTTA